MSVSERVSLKKDIIILVCHLDQEPNDQTYHIRMTRTPRMNNPGLTLLRPTPLSHLAPLTCQTQTRRLIWCPWLIRCTLKDHVTPLPQIPCSSPVETTNLTYPACFEIATKFFPFGQTPILNLSYRIFSSCFFLKMPAKWNSNLSPPLSGITKEMN
jgi:hypothetical protein